MSTAAAIQGSSATLHDRGTWSARDDRLPSAVCLGILWAGMIAGFGLDMPRFLRENPPAPEIVHIHAVVFTAWLIILTAQVLLVLGDRVAWHKTLGWFAAAWACLMAVLGPWAAMAAQVVALDTPLSDPPFFSVNLVDIGGFLILLAWGLALRKNPAAHRRMMILATVSLADPGFSRFGAVVIPQNPHSVFLWYLLVFYGNLLLIGLMAGWDWWKGRLMRSFVFGAAGLLVSELGASILYFWPPWRALTLSWVQAWAKI